MPRVTNAISKTSRTPARKKTPYLRNLKTSADAACDAYIANDAKRSIEAALPPKQVMADAVLAVHGIFTFAIKNDGESGDQAWWGWDLMHEYTAANPPPVPAIPASFFGCVNFLRINEDTIDAVICEFVGKEPNIGTPMGVPKELFLHHVKYLKAMAAIDALRREFPDWSDHLTEWDPW